jgi:WD40 repeat protein
MTPRTGSATDRFRRWLFGDDVFVSYGRSDASEYALALGLRLTERGIACYLDQWGSHPGRTVGRDVLRRVRLSTMMVVIGSEAAGRSERVREEIVECLRTGGTIVPVSFGPPRTDFIWSASIHGIAPSVEPPEALAAATPSDRLIDRIANAEGFTKRNVRLRRIALGTAAGIFLLLIASIVLTVLARQAKIDLGAIRTTLEQTDREMQARDKLLESQKTELSKTLGALETSKTTLAATEKAVREQQRLVETSRREVTSQELVAASIASRLRDPERSIALAVKAVEATWRLDHSVPPGAERALHEAILSSPLRITVKLPDEEPPQHAYDDGPTPIMGVSYSADGKVIATAGRSVQFWDAATGRNLGKLDEPLQDYLQVLFSSDGAVLATAGQNNVVVRHASTRNVLYELPGQIIAFSDDGKWIASSPWNDDDTSGFARIYDAGTGKELHAVPHSGNVGAIAICPGKDHLAITNATTARVTLWSLTEGKEEKSFTTPPGQASSVSFADEDRLFVGGLTGVTAYRISTDDVGAPVVGNRQMDPEEADVGLFLPGRAITQFDKSGDIFATVGDHKTIRIIDRGSLDKPARILRGHDGDVLAMALTPDGRNLASGSSDGTLKVWDLFDASELPLLNTFAALAFSVDGKLLVTSFGEVLDVRSGQKLPSMTPKEGRPILAISPDWKHLVVDTERDGDELWSMRPLRKIRTIREELHGDYEQTVAFTADGSTLVVRSEETVALWDVAEARKVRTFSDENWKDAQWGKKVLAVSVDGRLFATATGKGNFTLTDAITGKTTLIKAASQPIHAMAFTPDGKRIATGTGDKFNEGNHTADLWDTATGTRLRTIPHDSSITALAFTPDGKRLGTATVRSTKIWDARSGQEIVAFDAGGDVLFSPDGGILATRGPDVKTALYIMDIDELLKLGVVRSATDVSVSRPVPAPRRAVAISTPGTTRSARRAR